LLPIDAVQRAPGGLDQGVVDGHDPRITVAAQLGEADAHGFGSDLVDVVAQRLEHRSWILVGHQPAADFGGRPRRDDRLGTGSLSRTRTSASACAGFGATPPSNPECMSVLAASTRSST